jgi:two-component system response regulator FixJ
MTTSDSAIYIVDDDAGSRNSVRALVATMGLTAFTYASAEEFLNAYHGEPGCLVTDLRMPGLNAIELLDALHESGRSLPTIVITAYAEVPVAVEAMQKGAISLLEKPYRGNELWTAIRQALDQDSKRRARRVTDMVVSGDTNKAIALNLGLSTRTVEGCRQKIFEKLGVDSVAQLVQDVMVANKGMRPSQHDTEG